MKNARLFVVCFLLGITPAFAQFDPQPEPGQLGLSVTGRGYASGKAPLKRGDTTYEDVRFSSYDINVTQVLTLAPRETLRLGIEQQTTFVDQSRDSSAAAVPLPDDLKAMSFTAAYTRPIDPQWMISARAAVGSYVGGSNLLSDGWGVNASVVGIYSASQTTTWVFGLAYNSLMSDLRVLPVFGAMWRPSQQWTFAFGFPKTAATYHFSRDLSLGVAMSGSGGAYKIKDEPASGSAGRTLAGSKLEQRELRLGVEASWKASPSVRFTGTVGSVLYRKFEYVDRDFELKQRRLAPFISGAATISF